MKQSQARNTTLYTGIVKALRTSALAATFALSVSTTALAQTGDRARFDIPEQPLSAALKVFAEQAGMQLLYRPETINGTTVQALRGELDKRQALQRLLQGTDLEVVYSADNAATIRPRAKEPVTKEGNTSAAVAEASSGAQDTSASSASAAGNERPPASERSGRAQDLETVVVTGTRIRGGSTPSPVITIGSERIREEGFSDLGEVIRSVPQNFSGGQNPGVARGSNPIGGGVHQNATGGSALNLRGLGSDASLTLLNGRRMSYSGPFQAVDISAIPVEAVERIEIVADGASAIYGSDAVGGVANVILKPDFEGVALGTRYGTATDGGLTTREYTATAGTVWSGGGLIATYLDVSTDPIYARQRDYTDHMVAPTTIYPGNDLRSGLLSLHQRLGDAIELRVDTLRTEREQVSQFFLAANQPSYRRVTPETTTTFVAPSIEFSLPGDWMLSVAGTRGKDEFIENIQNVTVASGGSTPASLNLLSNELRSYEVGVEGSLFALGGGEARLAAGVGYRTNDLLYFNYLTDTAVFQDSDNSRSAYAEIYLPLVGPDSNISGARRLELTAAARSEDYSSFGRVTTPKLGLVYGPNADFTLKTTWGKSFKTPTLSQRYGPRFAILYPPTTLGGAGYPPGATMLVIGGSNPDLDPERAKTWSASVAFHPEGLPGLDVELSWFNIAYTDRVVQPVTNIAQALNIPAYAEFFRFSPTVQEQAALIAAVDAFSNASGAPYDPNNVAALLFIHWANASEQQVKGLDLSGSYRFDLGMGRMTIRGSAAWLDSTQQTSSAAIPHDLAGTLFSPAKISSRVGAVWHQGGFSASAFANHLSGVTDTVRNEKGGSFTTFDTTLSYGTGGTEGFGSGWRFSLSATNLFNRTPPLYVTTNPTFPPYDSTNYSAIGRFLSISVSKNF